MAVANRGPFNTPSQLFARKNSSAQLDSKKSAFPLSLAEPITFLSLAESGSGCRRGLVLTMQTRSPPLVRARSIDHAMAVSTS